MSYTQLEDDAQSDSSSVVYNHEPFISFRSRVLEIALCNIWPDSSIDEIQVERLQGGGFNRVIGLTRQTSGMDTDSKTQYILRIPRFDSARIDNDVAILQFLYQHTTIPAPEVIYFDETSLNALGSPYSIQNRILGVDLYSSFSSLTHENRCRLARDLGSIFNKMLSVRSSEAGRLVLSDDQSRPNRPIHVAPFMEKDRKFAKPYNDSSPSETIHQLLTATFLARKAQDIAQSPSDTVGPRLWDQLCRMASQLETGGWLGGCHFSLAHLDLAPRNILIQPTSTHLPLITGILDWDSAVLGPQFLSCAPPMWLWAWQDDEDEDERQANAEPPTPQGRQLKELFEEAAGHTYMCLAYEPAYRLGRRLAQFAIEGVRSNEDFKEATAMLTEWGHLIQSSKDEH